MKFLPAPHGKSSTFVNTANENKSGKDLETLWLNRIRKEMTIQMELEKRKGVTNNTNFKYQHPTPFNVKTILTHLPISGPGKVYQNLKTSYQRHYTVPGSPAAELPPHATHSLHNFNSTTAAHTYASSIPMTSNATYGWQSRNEETASLELYGSTSTNPKDTSKLGA
ncbi:hypothetical protein HMI54_000323 [Coelomomyces lativittatus]|nr:hypothetical protein HMI55_001346 [Coelomomyces lativittatus]KAJ1511779.1 hypothetical protein HMI56_004955 [Coelomomyces lativittatus]KAJ1518476.1 hypothetical protein HMI54_000323 [Coelomomyces lativittatus]